MALRSLPMVPLAALILSGCLGPGDGGWSGKWTGETEKRGTMCVHSAPYRCDLIVPWLRKDVHNYDFKADGTGTDEYHYVRINGDDASESWRRLDSLTYSLRRDSLEIIVRSSKYEGRSEWEARNDTAKYKYRMLNGELTLEDYKMWDTATYYLSDLKLIRLNSGNGRGGR